MATLIFMPRAIELTCVCGHGKDAHEHYRRGSDCGSCGKVTCPKFRRDRGKRLRVRSQQLPDLPDNVLPFPKR